MKGKLHKNNSCCLLSCVCKKNKLVVLVLLHACFPYTLDICSWEQIRVQNSRCYKETGYEEVWMNQGLTSCDLFTYAVKGTHKCHICLVKPASVIVTFTEVIFFCFCNHSLTFFSHPGYQLRPCHWPRLHCTGLIWVRGDKEGRIVWMLFFFFNLRLLGEGRKRRRRTCLMKATDGVHMFRL